MVDEKAFHLLRVLKDVNRDELITKLNHIKQSNDSHISHLFLEEYFRNKDACISSDVYRYEAECIVDIFPQYSVEYIQSMLETLGSENNRVIIILRQLLKNEPINNFTNDGMLLQNQILPDYLKHRDSVHPSTSSDALLPKCDHELRNTFDTKQTATSLKRKFNIFLQPKSPKIKIVPIASMCNSTSQNRYNYIPETFTSGCSMNIGAGGTYTNYRKDDSMATQTQVEEYGFKSSLNPNLDVLQNLQPKPAPTPELFSYNNSPENFLTPYLFGSPNGADTPDQQGNQNEPLNLPPIENNLEINPDEDVDSVIKSVVDFLPPLEMNSLEQEMHQNFPLNNPENSIWNLSEPGRKLFKELKGKKRYQKSDKSDIAINEPVNLQGPAFEIPQPQAYPIYAKHKTTRNSKAKIPSKITIPKMNALTNESLLEISSEDDDISDRSGYFSSEEGGEESNEPSYMNEAAALCDNKLVSKIMEMFPDASPTYVKELCVGKTASPVDVDNVLHIMLSNPDYPKRKQREPSPDLELDLEKQVALFREVLPDADPNFLQYHAELYLHDKKKLAEFISNALELRNYPTIKEYIRKQQLSAQVKQYTTEFDIEKFLEIIPDPDNYFNDPKKKSSFSINERVDVFSLHYATGFLKNQYPTISIKTINYVLSKQNDQLIATVKELDKVVASKKGLLKSRRKPVCIDNTTIQNIPLLQEIAYLSHRDEIKCYLQEKEAKEKEDRQLAKANGLLHTCKCCYNEEVMPKNIVKCTNGCDFCNECVKTSAEILFGENKLDFPCLQDCNGFFSLQTLKDTLSPKMFSKMAQKKQLEEVKAAGIEELEMCPFCDFATIPAPGDKLFRCLNPECMKESCRQCKEPSHVPLRCDEIEKDDDVKRRTYIENKMTEALIRICYKCGMKFIKADGCNKMTCSCGAMMCYVCGQPVQDYKHFNGQGGDRYHLCPLYSDTNKLHKEDVIKGAEQAKAEIGVAEDSKKLKIDPAADLNHHYKTKKAKNEEDRDVLADGIVAERVRLENLDRLIAELRWNSELANSARRQRHRNGHHNQRHHHHHH